jgi:chromatin segregation and condensation protein Rec8/ScpA/Scc1 (kleisin family)
MFDSGQLLCSAQPLLSTKSARLSDEQEEHEQEESGDEDEDEYELAPEEAAKRYLDEFYSTGAGRRALPKSCKSADYGSITGSFMVV